MKFGTVGLSGMGFHMVMWSFLKNYKYNGYNYKSKWLYIYNGYKHTCYTVCGHSLFQLDLRLLVLTSCSDVVSNTDI